MIRHMHRCAALAKNTPRTTPSRSKALRPVRSDHDRRDSMPNLRAGTYPRSPRLDVGGPDHLAPNFDFDLDLLGHVLGRACHRLEAECRQAFPGLRKRDAAHNLAIEGGHDVLRRSGRYEY